MKKFTAAQKRQLLAVAEAMVKGAKKHKQGYGDLFVPEDTKNGGEKVAATCALGAVYEGMFGPALTEEEDDDGVFTTVLAAHVAYKALRKKFPMLEVDVTNPVEEGAQNWSLQDTIIDLNDNAGWTRAKIAKWVRSLAK